MNRFIFFAPILWWMSVFAVLCQADEVAVSPCPQVLSYEEAVHQGLEHNLDIIAQNLNISLSEASEMIARALANPTVQLDTQLMPFGTNWNQTSSGGPAQHDILLNIPVDLTKKRAKAEAAAHFAKLVTEAQFQSFVRNKKTEIQISYLSLTTLQSQIEVLKERQEAFHRLEHTVENQIGNARLLPQLQERVRLATAQAKLELQSRMNESDQEAIHLATLLGLQSFPNHFQISTPLQKFPKYPKDLHLQDLVNAALKNRADLKALEFQRTQADLELSSANARILDDLTIIAGVSRQSGLNANSNGGGPYANSPTVPGAWSWTAGVVIPIPVLSQNQGGIKRAQVLQDQADAQIRALQLQIRADVQTATNSLEMTSKQLWEFEENTLVRARKVRDGVQRLFGTGGANFLEYLDAVNTYQAVVSSYFQVLSDHRKAIIRLNQSIGTDLIP